MVSSKPDTTRDPDIESLLNQSADPRLAWVNRQMYLSLRSLDMELHREQRIAACEHPQSSQMLEARSGDARDRQHEERPRRKYLRNERPAHEADGPGRQTERVADSGHPQTEVSLCQTILIL